MQERKNEADVAFFIILITALIVGTLFCAAAYEIGMKAGVAKQKQAAIEAGVAQYEVDSKTGIVDFIFLTKDCEK